MKIQKYLVIFGTVLLLLPLIYTGCTLPEVPDTVPPTCTIIYPASGQAVTGVVGIRIGAVDDDEVDRIVLYIDGEQVAVLSGLIVEYPWDTQPYGDNRDHHIQAVAIDKQDNLGYSGTVSVRVVAGTQPDTLAPTIAIVSPQSGTTIQDTVRVIPQITDDGVISHVEYFVDGHLRTTISSSPFEYLWDVHTLVDGSSHSLFARVYDSNLNNAFSPVVNVTIKSDIIVDNTAPTVSIIYPTPGVAITDSINVLLAANDNVGLDRLEFYVDGQLQQTRTQAPWKFPWDVSGFINGSSHTIFVKAYDTSQNETLSAVLSLTVQTGNVVDTTPPTVFLSYPPVGTLITGTTTLIATAGDNIGVVNVEFYIDGLLAGNDITSPYEYVWDVSALPPGSAHTIYVQAYDGAGNTAQSGVTTLTLAPTDNVAPVTTILYPNAGAVITSNITIAAQAQDNIGVDRVEFWIDGQVAHTDLTEPYTYDWDITSLPNASVHSLMTKAFDAAGNFGTSGLMTVTVQNQDITPPTVVILYPTAGNVFTAGDTVSIKVDAQDNVGIDRVEFWIDGSLLSTDTSAPYQYDWNTTGYGNGQSHSIYIKAYDLAGNQASALTTVVVN